MIIKDMTIKTPSPTTKASSKFSSILPLCLVIFIDTFAMTMVYPLFAPLFSLDIANGGFFASDVTQQTKNLLYGLTMAIYPIMMFFAAPFLGSLSDRIGRKKVLLLCLCGAGVAAGLSGIAIILRSFTLFFITRIIAGAMAGSLPVAQAAITDISDERDKIINISLVGFAYTLGLVLGPVAGGILSNNDVVAWFDLATPFFVTGLLSIINTVILIATFKETLTTTWKSSHSKTIQFLRPLLMFFKSMQNRDIRNIMLVYFFYILGWNVYLSFIALHLFQKYQFTSTQIGYFVGWVGLILSCTMALVIRIMVKFFSTTQILYSAITLSILGILVSMLPNVFFQWVSAIPIACGMGLAYTTVTKLFSDAVRPELQGWIMGVSASTVAAAAGLGGILTGVVSANHLIAFILIITVWTFCLIVATKKLKPKSTLSA